MSTIAELGTFLARESGAAARPELATSVLKPTAVGNGTSAAGSRE
jgi:hypothetical protein